jgi:hypothetical protein
MSLRGRLTKFEVAEAPDPSDPRAYVGDLPPDFVKQKQRRWIRILSPVLEGR